MGINNPQSIKTSSSRKVSNPLSLGKGVAFKSETPKAPSITAQHQLRQLLGIRKKVEKKKSIEQHKRHMRWYHRDYSVICASRLAFQQSLNRCSNPHEAAEKPNQFSFVQLWSYCHRELKRQSCSPERTNKTEKWVQHFSRALDLLYSSNPYLCCIIIQYVKE